MRNLMFSGFGLALAFAAFSSPFTHLSTVCASLASTPALVLSSPQCFVPRIGTIQQQAQDHAQTVSDILDQMNALQKP